MQTGGQEQRKPSSDMIVWNMPLNGNQSLCDCCEPHVKFMLPALDLTVL